MIGHVLVGFDGSASARKALRFAHDLAAQTGARLTALLVLELPHVLPIGPLDSYIVTAPQADPSEMERVRRLLGEAVADLPAAKVDQRVEVGRAAEVLCEQATKLGVDLIVVGARGLGVGGRWLLGSVSDRVVHHADRPVTVVH
ncbi:MAG: universal stress protein [Deltaproteobacteria bacterium]|nr:universal stress protein [Deltaproteobacteria bacterium]